MSKARLQKLLLEEMVDTQKRIDYGLKPEVWNPRVLEIIKLGKKLTAPAQEVGDGA